MAALAAGIGAGTDAAIKDSGSRQPPAVPEQRPQPGNFGNGFGLGNGVGRATGPAATPRHRAQQRQLQQAVQQAVEPGLVDITSNLRYEGGTAPPPAW